MYNFMVGALKSRVIEELKTFFKSHPTYKNIEIFNRFLNQERIQEGIVVKNTTSSRVPLSADNFQGNVYSYVCVAKHSNFPGLAIEWVREDDVHLCKKIYKKDVSEQFYTESKLTIEVEDFMLKGRKDLSYANSFKDVEVYINNERIIPQAVDGKNKIIFLTQKPLINSKVEICYWVKELSPAGVYQIEIVKEDRDHHTFEFMVDCLLDKQEVLVEEATGKEQCLQLSMRPIFKNSLILKENDVIMERDTDYLLDEESGIITFLTTRVIGGEALTILRNSKIEALYRVMGPSNGPFKVDAWDRINNSAIPGVVIAFGKSVGIADKQFIIVNSERVHTALEYSGKWEMTISLDIYARDTIKIEEIIDLTTAYLNTFRKSDLDGEGIALVNVNFGGESEEIFDEATGDLYYKGSVDYNFLTEWIMHQPLLQSIEGFIMQDQMVPSIETMIIDEDDKYEKIK